jgi:hypothetical protein
MKYLVSGGIFCCCALCSRVAQECGWSYNMHVCPWSVDMSDSSNFGARHTVHSVLQFYCEEHTLD